MTHIKNKKNEIINLETIKEKLLARKRELEEEFSSSTANEMVGQIADSAEQASLTTLETIKVSLQGAEIIEYRSILQSLAMMQEGSYGLCADCSEPIAAKRLLLLVNAVRCLPCQELMEEGESD